MASHAVKAALRKGMGANRGGEQPADKALQVNKRRSPSRNARSALSAVVSSR